MVSFLSTVTVSATLFAPPRVLRPCGTCTSSTRVNYSNRTTFHSLTFCSYLGVGHTRNGLHPRFALATEKQLKPAKVSSLFSKRFLSTAAFHVFCEGLELELLLNLIVVTLMPVVDTYVRTVLVVLARY